MNDSSICLLLERIRSYAGSMHTEQISLSFDFVSIYLGGGYGYICHDSKTLGLESIDVSQWQPEFKSLSSEFLNKIEVLSQQPANLWKIKLTYY